MQRSITQSIAINAPPEAVLALVADPPRLPEWAPAFAGTIRADGDDWMVDSGQGEVRIRIRVSTDLGTIDFLAADLLPGLEVGAFTRVIANGRGSEFMFTQFFAPDATDAEVAEQTGTVAEELETVRRMCEADPA